MSAAKTSNLKHSNMSAAMMRPRLDSAVQPDVSGGLFKRSVDEAGIRRYIVAHDFQRQVQGKLPQEKIDAGIAKLLAVTETSYTADGALGGGLFGVGIGMTVVASGVQYHFDGSAFGFFTFGADGFDGQLYSDNFDLLFSNTQKIALSIVIPYMNILFYDGDSNLLGNFQGDAGGSVLGEGPGNGSWTRA